MAMPQQEIEARQAALRRIVHWLHYDRLEYDGRDAAAALAYHIMKRVHPRSAQDRAQALPRSSEYGWK